MPYAIQSSSQSDLTLVPKLAGVYFLVHVGNEQSPVSDFASRSGTVQFTVLLCSESTYSKMWLLGAESCADTARDVRSTSCRLDVRYVKCAKLQDRVMRDLVQEDAWCAQ